MDMFHVYWETNEYGLVAVSTPHLNVQEISKLKDQAKGRYTVSVLNSQAYLSR